MFEIIMESKERWNGSRWFSYCQDRRLRSFGNRHYGTTRNCVKAFASVRNATRVGNALLNGEWVGGRCYADRFRGFEIREIGTSEAFAKGILVQPTIVHVLGIAD